ncbi:MAG: hypothetical protein KDE22_00625 [Rhodobacterales bacterium]|nr:hypothetical protein [Rhodobacterales bacterium]
MTALILHTTRHPFAALGHLFHRAVTAVDSLGSTVRAAQEAADLFECGRPVNLERLRDLGYLR